MRGHTGRNPSVFLYFFEKFSRFGVREMRAGFVIIKLRVVGFTQRLNKEASYAHKI